MEEFKTNSKQEFKKYLETLLKKLDDYKISSFQIHSHIEEKCLLNSDESNKNKKILTINLKAEPLNKDSDM